MAERLSLEEQALAQRERIPSVPSEELEPLLNILYGLLQFDHSLRKAINKKLFPKNQE